MSYNLAHDQLLAGGRSISRRDFLRGIGFALAGGALLAIGGRLIATNRLPEVPGDTLMRSTFAGRIGEAFQIYQGAAAMPVLRLAGVRDLPAVTGEQAQASADKERSFSLLFTGPIDLMIEQGMYHFEHKQVGSFSLFIVPMAPSEEAHYYEAIFNRLQA
jgi:hypothetical protein